MTGMSRAAGGWTAPAATIGGAGAWSGRVLGTVGWFWAGSHGPGRARPGFAGLLPVQLAGARIVEEHPVSLYPQDVGCASRDGVAPGVQAAVGVRKAVVVVLVLEVGQLHGLRLAAGVFTLGAAVPGFGLGARDQPGDEALVLAHEVCQQVPDLGRRLLPADLLPTLMVRTVTPNRFARSI